MSTRSCPDWPRLLELAPDLTFKHYTAAEAQLPAEALVSISEVSLGSIEICADLDHNVFNPEHTDEQTRRGAAGDALVRPAGVDHIRSGGAGRLGMDAFNLHGDAVESHRGARGLALEGRVGRARLSASIYGGTPSRGATKYVRLTTPPGCAFSGAASSSRPPAVSKIVTVSS